MATTHEHENDRHDDVAHDDIAHDDAAVPEIEVHEGFLNPEPPRRPGESVAVRLIATAGIVGLGTALAAILGAFDVAVWVIGFVTALLSVGLAAVLWRSRVL